MRHAQTVVLQRADGPRRHKIATNQERRRQVLPFLLVKPLAYQVCSVSLALKLDTISRSRLSLNLRL